MEAWGKRLGLWLSVVTALGVSSVVVGCDKKADAEASAEKPAKATADEDEDDDGEKKSKKKKKGKKDDDGEKDAKDTAAKPAGTPADAAPSVTGNAPPPVPVTDPSLQTYPDLPNKIADNCQSPYVIMATAPESVGVDYPWTWSRQAMLANQQFKVVAGTPSAVGQVSFATHFASARYNFAWVLVAQCHDGGTCNKLASMYKAIVPGSQSQAFCGTWPMDLSPATMKKPVLRELGDPQNSLPQSSDTIGQCARLQACSVAMDPPTKAGKENIGLECQKAPSKFKRECAAKYPCSEVMACLGG
jgi:hypothetical protein